MVNLRGVVVILIVLSTSGVTVNLASAQLCPSVDNCRKEPPAGKLLHEPNSRGQRIWTTPCGPNTNESSIDPICKSIVACPDSGGFGKFLQAVTGECRAKHFDGYFGLDGMTFGILDWTWSNLPGVLKAYQMRAPSSFAAQFGKLNMPMKNGCIDANWTCRANQQAALMCEPTFRSVFSSALKTPEFRKAQMDYALGEYEQRLARYAYLGLKTEYGNTAMAVLANNLKRTASCKPSAWKAACIGATDERKLVDCMLEQYARNECRGSLRGSRSRVSSLRAVFSQETSAVIHPAASTVEQCVADWSKYTSIPSFGAVDLRRYDHLKEASK